MIITDFNFKRNVVHLNGNTKKKHGSLTENTIELKENLKIKIYSFLHMMCYIRDQHLFANPKTGLTHNETVHDRFLKHKTN